MSNEKSKNMKNRDNQQALIDNKLKHILECFIETFSDDEEDEIENKEYLEYARNLLQNAPETTKEQPNCNWERGKACFKPCNCFE